MLRLRALLLGAAVLVSAPCAHATAITYNITGGILSGDGGGTYSGTAIIDSATGTFSGGTFTVTLAGITYSNLTFSSNHLSVQSGDPVTYGGRYGAGNAQFDFQVLPSSVDDGYEGGDVCTVATCGRNNTRFEGNYFGDCTKAGAPCARGDGGLSIAADLPPSVPPSVPTASTPEPSSLVLLSTGILGLATTARRRLFKA